MKEKLPSFEESIGRHSPSPSELRDSKDFAAKSDSVSCEVSDKERVCREIQGVGADVSTCDNHTFQVLSNCMLDEIKNATGVHTIGSGTGEIGSVAIVETLEQTDHAHQAEQFVEQPNVSQSLHISDVCPQGIKLWQELFNGVTCRLGWFHFPQRITKTLRKEHARFASSVAALSECLHCFDPNDLEEVKRCLKEGSLGKSRNGEACPQEKIDLKVKMHQKMCEFGLIPRR